MKIKTICRFVFLLVPILLSGLSGPARAYELIETLAPIKQVNLEIAPVSALFDRDRVLVHGKTDKNTDALMWLDIKNMSVGARKVLPLQIQEVMFSADQRHIFVIGNRTSEDSLRTFLVVYDKDLELLSRVAFDVAMKRPASFVTVDDRVLVYDLASQNSKSAAIVLDVVNREKISIKEKISVPPSRGGVTDFWLLEDGKTVVLNAGYSPSLDAFDFESGSPIDSISYVYSGGKKSTAGAIPFTVLALADRAMCRMFLSAGNWASKFVLISNGTQELVLTGYSPKFRTIDIFSTVNMRDFGPLDQERGFIPDTDIRQSSSMLSGSCDLSVIWAANKDARQVTQYARNKDSEFLEKVGNLSLGFYPSALAVSDSAEYGVALSRDQKKLALFGGSPNSLEQGVAGREEVRVLQRLLTERGFLVGTIDGFLGAKTNRAIAGFEKSYGVNLNTDVDIEKAIEMISSVAPEY